jgi:hypothetical protein
MICGLSEGKALAFTASRDFCSMETAEATASRNPWEKTAVSA